MGRGGARNGKGRDDWWEGEGPSVGRGGAMNGKGEG